MLLLLVPLVAGAALASNISRQIILLSIATIVALAMPFFAEGRQWFVDVTPALCLVTSVALALMFKRFRARGTVNLSSGLPNLVALRAEGPQRDHALIVARIINYPQLAAAVAGESERALVDQIVQRLTVGAQDHVIFQGDEGIFAWLTEPGTAIGHHVEALHSLFRSPARIEGDTYDLNVTFGVEIGSGRSISQRLNSALVAADEAASEGLKWKYHDPERMKDASWRLSLLSQLDHAIDNGEVWVAFQPQLDLRTGRIRGAEALARWTHPEKGPISPLEFVSAAEQSGRIEKLTMFVLEQSVAAAARFNREGAPFDIAVNLSARMLTMKSFPMEVRAALARHGLDPARLTLELTETAALAGDGSDMAPLFKLRDLGVRLSIDDYGTGLSTLDYLKKVPAERDQDRPELHQGDARPPQRPRHGPVDHRPRPFARSHGRRRRRRNPGIARPAALARLRCRARLPDRPPDQREELAAPLAGRSEDQRRLIVNRLLTISIRVNIQPQRHVLPCF